LEVPERFKTKTIRKVCEFLEHHVKEPWSDLASPFLLDSFKKVGFVVLAQFSCKRCGFYLLRIRAAFSVRMQIEFCLACII
jgi:hypothetical protein